MPDPSPHYDVAIIGSGIGGSTLASVLARQGLSVIVFEGGAHPRFTIGESMILETSEAMRALAEFYDVPELAYYSSENFYSYIGTAFFPAATVIATACRADDAAIRLIGTGWGGLRQYR